MTDIEMAGELQEIVRLMERKLGILEEGELACCGVTLSQCHALLEIGRTGTISLAELAKLLDLDSSTMSRTVNNLVNSKLAERELDPNDRRFVTIQLTAAGKGVYCEIEKKMERYFIHITRSIPEDKRAQVLESFHMLMKAISETECCP
jgi:DNA-binding MarR family transcriptional regulator